MMPSVQRASAELRVDMGTEGRQRILVVFDEHGLDDEQIVVQGSPPC